MPTDIVDARVVSIDGAWNFRDAGGYPTLSGSRVRRRSLYRSDALHRLTRAGRDALGALELRAICDLRMPNERRGMLDRLPVEGRVRSLHLPLYPVPDMDPTMAARLWGFLSGRIKVTDYEAIVADSYRHLVRTQAAQLGRILALLSERDNLPLLVHCRGGKDRTGLVVALVHLLLGVSQEDVFDDFLLTNRAVAQNRARLLRGLRWFTLFQVPSAELAHVLEARREHLQGALELVGELGPSLTEYLVEAAGLEPAAITALRENLLE